MSFKCDKCGACCAAISPEYDRGDGRCKHLTKDNLCYIYDDRPLVCRIDEMFDEYYIGTMTREEYYEANQHCCKQLKQIIK